jgi:sugar phosphate permease
MKAIFLDKDSSFSIIVAGILSLIIGVGIARFSFTSLLPFMLEDNLSIKFAGFLASINYIGYFIGSVATIFIKKINTKVIFFRAGLIISIISTLILGISIDERLWIISRFFAGFGTAMCLVVC